MLGFPDPSRAPAWGRRRISPTLARNGMVCAAHPLAVAAGMDVLRRGGNAVDAAVAAGLAAAVTMPEMCGLGGDLFAIVHAPGEAPLSFLSSGIAATGASLEMVLAKAGKASDGSSLMPLRGPLSVGVPGMPAGYGSLLERFGSLSFGEAAASAIGLAEDGFPVSPLCAWAIDETKTMLARTPSTAAVLLPGGRPPAAGALLRQPGLASTLRRLAAAGTDDFYKGDLARRMSAFLIEAGGAMSEADFAQHSTVVQPPITTTYRGYTVCQTGLPSPGMILLEALNLVENFAGATVGAGTGEAAHLMVEAIKIAFADRLGHAQDPATGETPLDVLLSKAFAAKRFLDIDPERAAPQVEPALQTGDTTYLCTADGSGMMVSLIQSVSSAFGSGMIAGDTGVILNNRVGRGFSLVPGHPNHYAPGKKPISTLNCWSVMDHGGEAVMVGGSYGGDGQPQWGLQMLVGMIDGGLDVQAATELPRWELFPGTDPHNFPSPYQLAAETRMGEEALSGLTARGHTVLKVGEWGGRGGANIIARDPATGVLAGGSDPRIEGMPAGY
jgi:gamma-glutamyltranspeptidase/glutathione hydrolase